MGNINKPTTDTHRLRNDGGRFFIECHSSRKRPHRAQIVATASPTRCPFCGRVIDFTGCSKVCNRCNKLRPLTEFSVGRYQNDGRRGTCKRCDTALRRAAYYARKEAARES